MRLRRTVAGVALTTLSAGLLATIPLTAADAASPALVISQIYGGNGTTYANDYVELFNLGESAVPTTNMSIQYASATGSGNFTATALPDTTVPPGGSLLIALAGSNVVPPAPALPTPDGTGGTNLSASAGKVALARGTTSLGCNGGSTPCDSTATARIVDLVGYGTANYFEGAPAPAGSSSQAVIRTLSGCVDTDNNSVDFAAGAPAPRNSASPAVDCDSVKPPVPVEATIAEVQGDGATSPMDGELVTIEGVVVGDFQDRGQYGGYFVQSLSDDGNPATSEGIHVFDFRTAVDVGEHVRVTGTVGEFRSADTDGVPSGTETQLGSGATVERLGTAELPAPVELSLPFAGGLAELESYEGMRVTLPSGLIATDLYGLGRYGEVGLTSGELLRIPATLEQDAANDADHILLDDGFSGQNLLPLPYTIDELGTTLPRAGDALAEAVTGVLSFNFGFYRVEPPVNTTAGFDSRNERTNAPDPVGGDVQVASFNVLNYFTTTKDENPDARGADDDAELARQQAKLVSAITALDADVVGLIEIANDDGEALATLVQALNDAQAGTDDDYTAVQAPPVTAPNEFGGTYGTDAIRTAIIYRSSVVTPNGAPPSDPELLNPADPAFPAEPLFDRPPAIQSFTLASGSEDFTVLVNHLKSKGSTNEQCGTPDPLGGNCDDLRERQAQGILDLVDELGTDNALLLGDFNSYEEEQPVDVIRGGGFTSAESTMPTADRYSYSFDGEFGTLDYVFTSEGLTDAVTGIDIWHINSAEAPAYDYNNFNQPLLYAPDAFASSDHDPALVGLDLEQPTVADAGGPYTTRVDRNVTLDASGSSDPDSTTLTYAWDLDGDGAFDDATGVRVPFGAALDPGTYTVAVPTGSGRVPPGRR